MQPGGTGPTGPEIHLRPNYIRNCNKTAPLDLTFKGDDSYSLRAGAEYKKYEFASQSFRYEHGEASLLLPPAGSSIQTLTQSFCGLGKLVVRDNTPTCWVKPNTDWSSKRHATATIRRPRTRPVFW
jgi:iron complex outermembrane receptor protein